MAYETSSATNANGILDALRLFASAQGWIVDNWSDISNGKWLALHKGTMYVNLITDSTKTDSTGQIYLRGATGYNGGLSYDSQPGMRSDTVWCYVNDLSVGPFVSHHFFAGDTFIHCVIEVQSGRYTHLGFGILDKYGAYTGGEYVYGCRWLLGSTIGSGDAAYSTNYAPFSGGSNSSHVRFEEHDCVQATYNNWALISGAPASNINAVTGLCLRANISIHVVTISNLYIQQPNHFNGVSNLFPLNILMGRRGNNTSLLGCPKDMRYINMKNLDSGQEIVLGTDTWMIFPFKQKGEQIVGNDTPFSAWNAFAFKKVL